MPKRDIVAIASSTGGLEVLRTLVAGLPAELPAAVLLVHHIGAYRSQLPEILAMGARLPVRHGVDGEPVVAGTVYVAPPDKHLMVRENRIHLSRGPKENFTRPAADPLFRSVAIEYGHRAVGVVLTGELDDGAAGLAAIKSCGGYALVQDPHDATAPSMPSSAIEATAVDAVVPSQIMAEMIVTALTAEIAMGEPKMAKPNGIEWENEMAATGMVDQQQLDAMGHRSMLTCPECGGTLWRLDGRPIRFRCHTGHAYTEKALQDHQETELEQCLWSTIRRLHERMAMARERLATAEKAGDAPRSEAERQFIGQCEALEAGLQRFIEGTVLPG